MRTHATLVRRRPAPTRRPVPRLSSASRALHQAELRHILHGSRLQPRLRVGAANDACEREADRVADAVMRWSAGQEPVRERTRGAVASTDVPHPGIEAPIRRAQGSGRPLPEDSRAFFESRLGTDFRDVRVHTNPRAADAARAVQARAFTLGRDIFFDQGEYRPRQTEGRRLLAHELTHVAQQSTLHPETGREVIRRQEPVTTGAATVTVGAVVAKCIIGAITGALFDAAIQAALHSLRERTWRFWRVTLDYCSIILSAILGCIAAPISAFILEGWVTARLGSRLGGMAGTLIGKILLFIAKKLAIGIPKGLVGTLAKLGCVSPEQAAELGVEQGEG